MHDPEQVLLAALHEAPRRYRMPALPADAEAARAAGAATALAFAIEAVRRAKDEKARPPSSMKDLFTWALARLIGAALAPEGGDPAFQALVLRTRHAEVREHVRLAELAAADRRALRSIVDAVAHPGKLRNVPPGTLRDTLAQLHRLAAGGAWQELESVARQLLARGVADPDLRAALEALLAHPGLPRLVHANALRHLPVVQRYEALRGLHGPQAGSDAAAARGRSSARMGEVAEQATVEAFRTIAQWLTEASPDAGPCRVVRGLLTPRGFPGESGKAKEEWDAAILRETADGPSEIALLAEVKASPAAATPDFSRLVRGLERLAQARSDADYVFPSADGAVHVRGASLGELRPNGYALPPRVIYCCSAPPEPQPTMLGAASRAVLLAEPASLAFADALAQGGSPRHEDLAPVWDALPAAPRLRSALHQHDTSRAVREAMLHPEDLVAAVARRLGRAG